jgi:hypothetical protein
MIPVLFAKNTGVVGEGGVTRIAQALKETTG